jgi:hypothetical protein
MPGRYGADLAPQEVLDEVAKILAKDKSRLAGSNYPLYKGPTTAPMSSLTQRARTLKEEFSKKPAPYTKKLERVLNRSNEGVSPTNMAQQLAMLKQGQEDFNTNTMLGALRNQFRSSYEPRVPQFLDRSQQDINTGANKFSVGFGDLSKASGTLEQSSNQQLTETLKELQAQKEARREGLVGTLEQFGAQKHGHANLVNQAQRNLFNEEASAPYRRMELLREGVGPLTGNMGTDTHPDIQKQSGKEALNALRAYGVDVSKPIEEWDSARTAPPTYKGKLMADLPPEILASHSTLEAVSPKFKDTLYDKRKALLGQLMGDEGVGGRALANIPERMRGPIQALEEEAQRKLKKDMAAINSRFIRKNMYGSSRNVREAEERAQEISRATFEERNKLLEDAMKSGLSLEHQGQIGNLRQLGQYGEHGQKEFGDTLGNIKNMNKLGSTKWGNEQDENEELYKNYLNEGAWEWPHMKGAIASQARYGALGDVFRGMDRRSISLDQLAGLNTNYSELQKDHDTLRGERDRLRVDLDTKNKIDADLARQRMAAEAQQEAQRQAQRQAQQAEVQRLTALKDEQLLAPYRDKTIYNTPRMRQDIENLPYRDQGGLSWHPAAHFLRNYTNSLTLPSGALSDTYGMTPSNTFNHYFENPQNYPAGYLATYGRYNPPTTDLATLRKHHGFNRGGQVHK